METHGDLSGTRTRSNPFFRHFEGIFLCVYKGKQGCSLSGSGWIKFCIRDRPFRLCYLDEPIRHDFDDTVRDCLSDPECRKIRDLKLPGIKLPVCSVAGRIRCSIHRIRLCPDICPLVLVELMIFVVFCNLVLEFQGDRSIFCSSPRFLYIESDLLGPVIRIRIRFQRVCHRR